MTGDALTAAALRAALENTNINRYAAGSNCGDCDAYTTSPDEKLKHRDGCETGPALALKPSEAEERVKALEEVAKIVADFGFGHASTCTKDSRDSKESCDCGMSELHRALAALQAGGSGND